MGYTSSGGTKGRGSFNNTPATTSDLNQLLALLADYGNSMVGTEAERDALTGDELYEGLVFYNTDTPALEVYDGSGWAEVWQDTGWITISSFLNSFTAGGVTPQYRLKNGVVMLRGDLYRASAPTSTTAAFTLPAGYRPIGGVVDYQTNFFSSGSQPCFIEIATAGTVSVLCTTARTTGGGYSLVGPPFPVD